MCNLVGKIYDAFDFDGDRNLDKIEINALLNTLVREISHQDTSLNIQNLKDRFDKIKEQSEITEKMIME